MDYYQLLELLGNRERKKLARNTYMVRNGEYIDIILHSTVIIRVKPNGNSILNNGGWFSHTTKQRLNRYIPGYVSKVDGEWFYQERDTRRRPIAYFNGMEIMPNGRCINYWER